MNNSTSKHKNTKMTTAEANTAWLTKKSTHKPAQTHPWKKSFTIGIRQVDKIV